MDSNYIYQLCRLYVLIHLSVSEIKFTKFYFCPTGWLPGTDHCFKILGKADLLTSKELCLEKGSNLFEVHSWHEQRELEQFLKTRGIREPVWLDGYVAYTRYRPAMLKLIWSTSFFPRIKNFKTDFLSPFVNGVCVVIDAKYQFQWSQKHCGDTDVIAICARRRWKLSDYDHSAIQQTTKKPVADIVL